MTLPSYNNHIYPILKELLLSQQIKILNHKFQDKQLSFVNLILNYALQPDLNVSQKSSYRALRLACVVVVGARGGLYNREKTSRDSAPSYYADGQ